MTALVLRWRKPDPALILQWRGPDATVTAAYQANPLAPIATIIGPPGTSGDAGDAFQIVNRFSELTTSQARTEARQNLELQYIDAGTF